MSNYDAYHKALQAHMNKADALQAAITKAKEVIAMIDKAANPKENGFRFVCEFQRWMGTYYDRWERVASYNYDPAVIQRMLLAAMRSQAIAELDKARTAYEWHMLNAPAQPEFV